MLLMREKERFHVSRWLRLAAATVSMMLVGLYQYSWTLFVPHIHDFFGWPLPAIQLTFVISTWIMTWSQPATGFFADKRGPKFIVFFGALITEIGWIGASYANTLELLYLTYGLGSIGVGIFYATAIGVANKWFPYGRGFTCGLASFGYGFGATIFNPLISFLIPSFRFQQTFLFMGALMLIVLVTASLFIRFPSSIPEERNDEDASREKGPRDFNALGMISTWQWWLIYFAFIFTVNTGLMLSSQLTTIGDSFKISIDFVLITAALFPLTNGLGRIIGGFLSDKIGRQVAMVLYFSSQGVLSLALLWFGNVPALFVAIIVLIGLLWGANYAFFPSLIGDLYGRRNVTTNYSITYTAKAWGGILGGYVTSLLAVIYGGYAPSIMMSAAFCFISTILVAPKILRKPTEPTFQGLGSKTA